jgi:RHS repeat-associated protein
MIWSANLDNSNPSTSVYDGLGQRVQTTQAGVTKRYFYDINGSVVAEYEATSGTGYGVLKRLNICAAGRLLAVDEVQTDGTKITSYVMADRIGSTRVLMNAAGAVTSRHDYLPFGEELGAGTGAPGSPSGMRTAAQGYSAADNVHQRYADTRLDEATGLDHTLWRKLETRSGRWTTPDPYGLSMEGTDPQSFNRYGYVRNDPVNIVDPSGLRKVCPKDRGNIIYVCHEEPGGGLPGSGPIDGSGNRVPNDRRDSGSGPGTGPQNPVPLTEAQVDKLGSNLQKFLDDSECGKFINAMLGSLPNDVWQTSKYGGSLMDAFNRIKSGGGFLSGDTMSRGALAITNPNTLTTTFDSQRITPLITGQSWQQFGATVILAHELTHVFTNAPNAGVYGHLQMAQAASAAGGAPGLEFPTQQEFGSGDAYDKALSEYYNSSLSYACRKVKL